MLLKGPLAQEIRLGLPDCFSSWEGGVWRRDYGRYHLVCHLVSSRKPFCTTVAIMIFIAQSIIISNWRKPYSAFTRTT